MMGTSCNADINVRISATTSNKITFNDCYIYSPGSLILQGKTTVLPVAIRYVCPGVIKVGTLSSVIMSKSFVGLASEPENKIYLLDYVKR